ncbi:uncharacterized protein BX664DRAFT_287428 [Halteromyces radiatus]|uniref:uncharacterized protein n=1 Tax=Halteromyces radiatus TaxID=101107 RepID=UPI00221F1A84|nr:uncharacterized protein BX664DRAFT_287428 [Halteromyces radiatus]KAI8077842.1 hypothetical protein BX664DRAFT_287428 [Halteromyces radiatus]
MAGWTTIELPEIPSPNYILVNNISLKSSGNKVKEFFLFCGKIKEFEMQLDEEGTGQRALIHFERESAARTAALLSHALIDESHISASPYFASSFSFDDKGSDDGSEASTSQESKPKSRIVAEILASGYILQDHIVTKGLEYDNQYRFSTKLFGYLTTLQANVKQFDEKYRIWDKAVEMDQRFKIQEKMELAMKKAQEALNTPTGQKVHGLANQTMAHIATIHYEAKRIQSEKMGTIPTPSSSTPHEHQQTDDTLVTSTSTTTAMPPTVTGSA